MFTRTHLTVAGLSTSVGATDESPGYYEATETTAAYVVVDGCFQTEQEVRTAYRAQFGEPSPI